MKIYIASHSLEEAGPLRDALEAVGHEVVSRWLNEPFERTRSYPVYRRIEIAKMDAADVLACDLLVLQSGVEKYAGGKFVEAGIAIGAAKRVVVIGRRENILLWHPAVEWVENERHLLTYLSEHR